MLQRYTTLPSSHIIWKAVYNEKRITRNTVHQTSIDTIIEQILEGNYRLHTYGVVILGVARIHSKMTKYLLDDVSMLLSSLGAPTVRIVRNKAITLQLKQEVDYLSDSFLIDEPMTIKDIDFSGGLGDLDFGDVSIEEARGSDNVDITQIPIPPKRRKLVVDENTEYNQSEYSSMIRNVRGLIETSPRLNIDELLTSKFALPKEVLSKIEVVERQRRESIELAREGTVVESYADIDYSDGYEVQSAKSEESTNLPDFPEQFEFTSFVSASGKYEKAVFFMNLLTQASRGVIKVNQEEAFGKIYCVSG